MVPKNKKLNAAATTTIKTPRRDLLLVAKANQRTRPPPSLPEDLCSKPSLGQDSTMTPQRNVGLNTEGGLRRREVSGARRAPYYL